MKMLNEMHKQAVALICTFDSATPACKAGCKSGFKRSRVRAWLRSGDEGSNLVEFALILPMLIMFLTGIFSIGVAFEHQQSLIQAVGIAAAQLSQSRTTSVDPCAETWKAIKNAAPNLSTAAPPDGIGLTITMNGTNAPANASSCTGSLAALTSVQPGSITVTATYPCSVKVAGLTVAPITCSATTTEFEY
jgi:Flp pilus assembly protein TadG